MTSCTPLCTSSATNTPGAGPGDGGLVSRSGRGRDGSATSFGPRSHRQSEHDAGPSRPRHVPLRIASPLGAVRRALLAVAGILPG